MSARGCRTAGWAVTVIAFVLAVAMAVVVGSEVVQGPALDAVPGAGLVVVTGWMLAVATAATSLVLARAPFAWHADGLVSGALLVALAGTVATGWQDAPHELRSAGSVVAPLTVPLLLALVERRVRGSMRWAAAGTALVGALSVARYLVRDPFHDPGCTVDCSLRGVAPFPSVGAARVVDLGLDVATVAVALIAVGLTVTLAVRPRGRRIGGWRLDLAVAACASAAAACWAATGLPASRQTVTHLVTVALAALCVMAILIVVQPVLAVRRRQELRRLAAALGEQPPLGALEASLGRLLGDSSLRVAYWLPESRRYVDAAGDPIAIDARMSVTLTRDGQPLARVFLDDAARDAGELEDLIGSAARLAIDSERLQAEVRAQLVDLSAARQRVVAAADEARRGVERTIHDQVQSELVGALMELTSARSQAEASGANGSAQTAATLATEVRELVAELREFARGVYPAVLDTSGLPVALEALAERAPIALRIECRGAQPASAEAQRVAYLVVHDAVMQATEGLEIHVDMSPRLVDLTILGHPGTVREDIADRVGALGGILTLDAGTLRAVLPCG